MIQYPNIIAKILFSSSRALPLRAERTRRPTQCVSQPDLDGETMMVGVLQRFIHSTSTEQLWYMKLDKAQSQKNTKIGLMMTWKSISFWSQRD